MAPQSSLSPARCDFATLRENLRGYGSYAERGRLVNFLYNLKGGNILRFAINYRKFTEELCGHIVHAGYLRLEGF